MGELCGFLYCLIFQSYSSSFYITVSDSCSSLVYCLMVGSVLSTCFIMSVMTKELENFHLTQPQPHTTCTWRGHHPNQQTASIEMVQVEFNLASFIYVLFPDHQNSIFMYNCHTFDAIQCCSQIPLEFIVS